MSIESFQVQLCGVEEKTGELAILAERPWQMTLTIEGRTYRSEADDMFECLRIIRLELEAEHLKLCVNGARENVWPSGMSRDMGGGRRAYEMSYSRRASMDDLVDIFAPAPCERIVSVATQQAWVDQYFASVADLPPPSAVDEATRNPNGWVYRIDGAYSPNDAVPPEAIAGAWPVGPDGLINGPFVPNPNYRPESAE